MRVLIVEDDPDIADGLMVALRRAHYHPDHAEDGELGQEMALMNSYGVILMDYMLPKKDGRSVIRALRAAGVRTPILMLTARDEVADRVEGLDAGADDYLVKPFSLDELLARIRALGRRESDRREAILYAGDLEIDTLAQTVSRNGEAIHLTRREFELLEALARNRERVLTRDAILTRVWNNDEALPNTVNFHMASLRKKVDPEGRLIKTVHGFGYALKSAEEPPG